MHDGVAEVNLHNIPGNTGMSVVGQNTKVAAFQWLVLYYMNGKTNPSNPSTGPVWACYWRPNCTYLVRKSSMSILDYSGWIDGSISNTVWDHNLNGRYHLVSNSSL